VEKGIAVSGCFNCPEIKAPIVELIDCPKMVIKVKISTGKGIFI
jgi:hypothetical protein